MTSERQALDLVSFYLSEKDQTLPRLATRLDRLFGLRTHIHPAGFDPEIAFDADRGQYNSRILLSQLLRGRSTAHRVLAVTGVDLFIPILSFVFGEAQLGGRVAIVSIHRLRQEAYGLAENPRGLESRLAKEAIHELGHTFGLLHCAEFQCVMGRSTYVQDVDLKSERFCGRCTARLRRG